MSENSIKYTTSDDLIISVEQSMQSYGYTIVDKDLARPWGGFLCINEAEVAQFVRQFFPAQSNILQETTHRYRLSPKVLIIKPGARLSWQYHYRRAELWRFLTRGVYYRSLTDKIPDKPAIAHAGEVITLVAGERHRACGIVGEPPTIIAEIWQHTDPANPSTEEDIVRLIDDYKRC